MKENTWGEFDGKLTQWQGFRDRFRAAVHNDATITNAFKFLHLQNSLKGKAQAALGEWVPNDENYNDAWERLQQLYDRKYQTSKELIWKFTNLPIMDRASGFMLQKYSNTTHEVLRQLKAMGYCTDGCDVFIVHSIHDRLDAETKKAWELQRTSEMPTVQEMLTFLDKQAKAWSNAQFNEQRAPKDNRKRNSNGNEHKPIEKRAKFEPGKFSESDKKYVAQCAICKESHVVHRCPTFQKMNLQSKRKAIREHQLCHNCLKPSHYSKDCLAGDCNRCHVKHNSLICPENPANKSVSTVQKIAKMKQFKNSKKE